MAPAAPVKARTAISSVLPLFCLAAILSGFIWFLRRPPSSGGLPVPDSSPALGVEPRTPSPHCMVAEELLHAERGAELWHGWADEELFQLAVAADGHEALSPLDPTTKIGSLSSQSTYLPSKVTSRSANHRRISCEKNMLLVQDGINPRTNPRPKIAFLFLTTGALPFSPLWNLFFRGHEQLYNIYVHLYPYRVNLFNRSSSGVFWGRLIPPDVTERGTPSLVAAARRLLANALLDDPKNQYFAVVSDHCIPLHGFETVYKQLFASGRSFLEILNSSRSLQARYNARGVGVMLPEVPFSKFRVGSQFFIVNRKHARMIVSDKKLWKKFSLPCLSRNFCFAEEHYFSTLLEIEDPEGSTRFTLTYVNWSGSRPRSDQKDDVGGHPRSFRKEEITREFIQSIRRRQKGSFLFARKFDDDCLDALLRLSSDLLDG